MYVSSDKRKMGHGLGFQHSGIGDDTYSDKTDYMGFAVNMVGLPRKAFVSLSLAPDLRTAVRTRQCCLNIVLFSLATDTWRLIF
jgi:hypothetical protein